MNYHSAIKWLVVLIILLGIAATGVGLFSPAEGASSSFGPFTTLRGETVTLYGRPPYRYDSLLIGAGFRGADVVVLVLAMPSLIFATRRYQRRSLRGTFLLLGTLAFFLYNYASMALGAAYNQLFVVYVALFSASLFAYILTFASIDLARLPAHITTHMPHRALAIFMFVTGLVFLVVWFGLGIVLPMRQGQPPGELASYTTLVTHTLDLGVLMPVAFSASWLLRRRAPLGYLLAFTILIVGIFVVGASVPAATVSQWLAGYPFTRGEVLAFVIPFVVLGAVALWLAIAFLRNIKATPLTTTSPSDNKR